jgi:glyoxylase-like metal-dependent hydrolase (beta-lactamase superfamily II)
MNLNRLFDQLHLQVLERGWLSSNNVVFSAIPGSSSAVIDTGYFAHSAQTVALVRDSLAGTPLSRILNTHLHSDHCGGNAALQRAFDCETAVPAASIDAVTEWNQDQLTFDSTAQRCERFDANCGLEPGSSIVLGGREWQILKAPGHDNDALMFFEPDSRVLISGDALWENRLAIIFPEIEGNDGFSGVAGVLAVINELNPTVVIPGHGRPFGDVPQAIAISLKRLQQFQINPDMHFRYASRALTMFRMLELQRSTMESLVDWILSAPIFLKLILVEQATLCELRGSAEKVILQLITDGILQSRDGIISVKPTRRP